MADEDDKQSTPPEKTVVQKIVDKMKDAFGAALKRTTSQMDVREPLPASKDTPSSSSSSSELAEDRLSMPASNLQQQKAKPSSAPSETQQAAKSPSARNDDVINAFFKAMRQFKGAGSDACKGNS